MRVGGFRARDLMQMRDALGSEDVRYNGNDCVEDVRMGLPKSILTEDEDLAFERAAEERHVFVDGEVFSTAGESWEHGTASTNILRSLANQLDDGPCEARSGNTEVRIGPLPKSPKRPAGLYSYPDIVVVYGEPKFLDEHKDVLLNPKVIVETLSESTEAFDRGLKFVRYQQFNPTLTDYILVSQDRPQIEHYQRQKDSSWKYTIHQGLDAVVMIKSIKCKLNAADVYKRITFASETED
ncbi:MAG: Uma2 family endonuclease [Planctomycetes bacterium]|nr:Uma2 family endonuclease [Planctomycetota bacterium]